MDDVVVYLRNHFTNRYLSEYPGSNNSKSVVWTQQFAPTTNLTKERVIVVTVMLH